MANNLTQVFDISEHFLLCGHCNKKLQEPKQLSCLHSICSKCLLDLATSGNRKCPTCYTLLDIEGPYENLPEDRFVVSLLEATTIDTKEDTDFVADIIESIEQEKQDVKNSIELTKHNMEQACQTIYDKKVKGDRKKMEVSNHIITHFSTLRQKMQKYLMEQEQNLLTELEEKATEIEQTAMEDVVKSRAATRAIEEREQLMEILKTKSIKNNAVASAYSNIFRETKNQMQEYEQIINRMQTKNYELTYIQEQIRERDMFPESIGKIKLLGMDNEEACGISRLSLSDNNKQTPESAVALPSAPILKPEPLKFASHLTTFNTLEPEDKTKCYIVAIAWISPDSLIAVDRWNRKIKLIYDDGRLDFSLHVPEGEPTDVAFTKFVANRYRCVVTLPSACMIGQITVTERRRIAMTNHIRTTVGYSSVAYDRSHSRLICGVCQPFGHPRVDLVNANGSVFMTFAVDSNQTPLFTFPRSIDVTDDGIITVCDWKKNRLVFLQVDGKILGSFQGSPFYYLKDCVGTTLDHRGNIFVSDRRSNCIVVVEMATSRHICNIEFDEEISEPREINLLCTDDDYKLAVSHGVGKISIYQLSDTNPTPKFFYDVKVDK